MLSKPAKKQEQKPLEFEKKLPPSIKVENS